MASCKRAEGDESEIQNRRFNDPGVTGQRVRICRVFANGDGCEVTFTLFQTQDMPESQFADDAKSVEADLAELKRILESSGK